MLRKANGHIDDYEANNERLGGNDGIRGRQTQCTSRRSAKMMEVERAIKTMGIGEINRGCRGRRQKKGRSPGRILIR